MPQIYTTKQGETVDLVCSKFYGRTRDATEAVLNANPGVAALGLNAGADGRRAVVQDGQILARCSVGDG